MTRTRSSTYFTQNEQEKSSVLVYNLTRNVRTYSQNRKLQTNRLQKYDQKCNQSIQGSTIITLKLPKVQVKCQNAIDNLGARECLLNSRLQEIN